MMEYIDHGDCIQHGDMFFPRSEWNRHYVELINLLKSGDARLVRYVPAELTWDQIRPKRNRLLRECDWTVLPDVPLAEEEQKAWQVYRTTLRDLTDTFENPQAVIWPSMPRPINEK